MLPYTPLHHLLMREVQFPVVATSGNLSEEPICTDEQEALVRLRGIADVFLVHDRPILRHVDDSIVREVAGRELVVRRARGFAPLPVQVVAEQPPLLAVGAHQKNAIACSVGRQVFISQHIGDLETAQSSQAFENVIAAFQRLYELKPQAIACDMHPDYVSTQFARRSGLPIRPVQHHEAHVRACMAENELAPPVLGISWDGSGYGPDATVWGGEFLRIEDAGVSRIAHLRTFRLPGGEKAVKEPRRTALAVLYEIFGPQVVDMANLAPVAAFSASDLRVLTSMLARKLNSPVTSSAGRLFDAVASIANLRHTCHFEGQAAMELEFSMPRDAGDDVYPFAVVENATSFIVDWEPMIRAMLAEKPGDLATIALKFHNTLADMMVAIAERAGCAQVCLTGGCFQNRFLTERAVRQLARAGFRPYWHQLVPPNDGGIALGQIMAAQAQLARE
jgi:hydrogenase maturation protein HypF